jgi:DNA mismatch repair protein MutS
VSRAARGGAPHILGTPPTKPRHTVSVADAGDTPILREYRAVKDQYRDAIVLARLGDFYEMFGEDAEVAAPLLGLTLTGRGFGSAGRVPMCGFPNAAASQYIRQLLDSGKRVALWDQTGEVVSGRLVERRVTRVLSAGTVIESELLEPAAVKRCVALYPSSRRVGVAALDPSTGAMELSEVAGGLDSQALMDEFERLDAAEVLLPDGFILPERVGRGAARTFLAPSVFQLERADERLRAATGTATLDGLALDGVPAARAAAGALLGYAERAQIVLTPDLLRVAVHESRYAMRLDAQTRRNLELFTPLSNTGRSLMQILDRTRTAMGARLLRAWLHEPLVDAALITRRADGVEALAGNRPVRQEIADSLGGVRDLERLVARCVQGNATPRDLAAVRDACDALPQLREVAMQAVNETIVESASRLAAPQVVVERLHALLADDPPATARDGGAIRNGADEHLDSLTNASSDARIFISTLEARERERSGLRSLRVGYNRVFGYYIEVANAHRDNVPADYVRKQTLAGAERFITADLKEQETIVLHAREQAIAREQELLAELMLVVATHAAELGRAASAAAYLDAVQSLATAGDERRWVRPVVDTSSDIDITQGRHPLVELALGPGRFVPNDCRLDGQTRILVLTGPNMAGKSTYLRQTAIIVLLAQIGSFVPAEAARIGVCDRVFTRIGAHDDLSGGLSTFMVEMAETAAILRQATESSLVILDEIGRGTSTYDGLSIAQAVIEHLHDSPQLNARTLFATHYHELTALAERLPRVSNARVEVVEDNDAVTFLHRIVAGGADRSYGIHVAKLAGVPASVLARARDVLGEMERNRPLMRTSEGPDQLALPITERAST